MSCRLYFSIILFVALFYGIEPIGKIPDFIQLCKKDDPQLDACLTNLLNTMRPKLAEGIPEAGIPPIDPLFLSEIVISRGGKGQMKAIGHNATIYGGGNYRIDYLRANLERLEFNIGMYFPWIRYDALYDVNANLFSMPIKGKGPVRGNVSEVSVDAVLKGVMRDRDGRKYVEFTSATVNVRVKHHYVKVEKMFKDRALNDALNKLLNDKRSEAVISARPMVNKVAASMILEMINRIVYNFYVDEIFL